MADKTRFIIRQRRIDDPFDVAQNKFMIYQCLYLWHKYLWHKLIIKIKSDRSGVLYGNQINLFR